MYEAQENKDADLHAVLTYLENHSQGELPNTTPEYDRVAWGQKAYADAATRLRAVLSTPVAQQPYEPEPFPPPLRMEFAHDDMCVVLVAPAGALGPERTLYFDRHSAEFMRDPDNLDRWVKLVAAALLQDALNQLGV
jgi:hypothetical protein